MAYKGAECIECCSRVTPLGPGDVISTGTNHQGLAPLQDGDELVLEVEKVGSLHLRVEDPAKRDWPRGVDQAMADRMRGGTW